MSSERNPVVPFVCLMSVNLSQSSSAEFSLCLKPELGHSPASNHWQRDWDRSDLDHIYCSYLHEGRHCIQIETARMEEQIRASEKAKQKLQKGEIKYWELSGCKGAVRNQKTFPALKELVLRLWFSTISDLANPPYYNMGTFITSITPTIVKQNSYITYLYTQFQKGSVQDRKSVV